VDNKVIEAPNGEESKEWYARMIPVLVHPLNHLRQFRSFFKHSSFHHIKNSNQNFPEDQMNKKIGRGKNDK